MKKIILLATICIFLFTFGGCRNKNVKNEANEAINIFSSGDIIAINNFIFGRYELEMDSEIEELLETEDNTQQGVLSNIFSNSTLSIKKINKDTVEFKIAAPNMEKVFENLPDNSSTFSEEDLLDYIKKYANDTAQKEFSVSVPYTINDEKVVIDYCNKDFINAISGGLLEAYKQLYVDILNEYQKGVN